jgi:hypothetical protein
MFFWKRLDHPGHDSCRLFKLPDGWRLSGAAVFRDENGPCHFLYDVFTDPAWKTRCAMVSGYLGRKPVALRIRSPEAGRWSVNGLRAKDVDGCIDIDLAFTPATNLIALRRLRLEVGQRAETTAAWLRFPEMRLARLFQRYRRTGRTEYRYEAPAENYAGTLLVQPSGAVILYPGFFEMVTSGRDARTKGKRGNP